MFEGASSFNGDISKWRVVRVTDMSSMFEGASSFNCNGKRMWWCGHPGKVTSMRKSECMNACVHAGMRVCDA